MQLKAQKSGDKKGKKDEWIKAYNDIDVKEMKELMKMKQDMLEAKNLAIEKNRIYQEELAADLERQERIKKLEQRALDDFNRMENMGPQPEISQWII